MLIEDGVPFHNEVDITCDCGKHLHIDFTGVFQPDTICSCPNCQQSYLLSVEPEYDMVIGDIDEIISYGVSVQKLSETGADHAMSVPTNISASFDIVD